MGFHQPKMMIFLRKPWKTMRFNHDGPCRLAGLGCLGGAAKLLKTLVDLLDVIYRENHQ
jgi:hypothetical protein